MTNLFCDIGGVLIDLDTPRAVQSLLALVDTDRYPDPQALVEGPGKQLAEQYHLGLVTTQQFADAILRYCRPGTTTQQVMAAWDSMLGDLPERRLHKLQQLSRQGVKVYLFSNINESHIQWTEARIRQAGLVLGRDIQQAFYSNRLHLAKPDPAFFRKALSLCGADPAQTLYIDDLPQNIQVGQSLGFQTLCAKGDEWLDL